MAKRLKKERKIEKKPKLKVSKFIYWTPRIFSILFLCFLTIFSFDEFGNGYSFSQLILGLFMHNIPVLILLIVLLISWKYEIVGAITFLLAGIAYIISALFRTQFQLYVISWILTIAVPAFFIAILFWLNWIKKK